MSKTQLIFFGPPGAGKGTQAKELSNRLEIPHISTGDILRNAIAQGTPLGKKAQQYVEQGDLVPDELILDLIRERLSQEDTQKGWILDGFPRNVSQASFLENLLQELNKNTDAVVYFEVPDEELVKRLLSRGRQDDTEETIRHRLDVYREKTSAVIDFYRQRNCLYTIDGNRLPEEVTASLKESLEN